MNFTLMSQRCMDRCLDLSEKETSAAANSCADNCVSKFMETTMLLSKTMQDSAKSPQRSRSPQSEALGKVGVGLGLAALGLVASALFRE